jgi:hypothetical protein
LWSRRGPRTRFSEGWNWVSRPRIRFEMRGASAARSWSKPTRTGVGGVRDCRGVLRVGLRLARVKIGDPPHGQAGQVGNLAVGVRATVRQQTRTAPGLMEALLPEKIESWHVRPPTLLCFVV